MPYVSPTDRDSIIRTVIGEADDEPPQGQAAVAHVIMNRLGDPQYGMTVPQVVFKPGAFTAWHDRPKQLAAISPNSPQYQATGKVVDGVLSGQTPDPTNGAEHYFNPVLQAANRAPVPSWAHGQPMATIGRHQFYAGEGDLLGRMTAPMPQAPAPAAPAPSAAPVAAAAEVPDHLGALVTQPAPATAPAAGPTTLPGQYVNEELAQHQGTGWGETVARAGLGALRGVGDIADTLAQGITSAGQYGAKTLLSAGIISPELAAKVGDWATGVQGNIAAQQTGFNAAAAASPMAQVGRFAGQVVGTAPLAEAAPLTRLLSPASAAIRTGLAGAEAGATATGLTSASSDEPLSSQLETGALTGGALGVVGRGASQVGAGLRRLIMGQVDPESASLAAKAINTYGIPITAGQLSSSPPIRFLDSVLQRLPLSGYGARTAAQQTGLNQAVAREMGVTADKITPDVVNQAKKSAYAGYDAAKAQMGGQLPVDAKLFADMDKTYGNAQSVLEQPLVDRVEKHLGNVFDAINPNATMDADKYQALTRKGGPLDSAINSKDSRISSTALEIKNNLDNWVGRQNPMLKQLKDEADYKYFVAKSVEPLAAAAPTGDIPAQKLLRAVDSSSTDVGELGRIAQRFMKEPPSSGTMERLLTMGGLGAAAGDLYQSPEHAQSDLGLLALTLATGRGAGMALRSKALTNAMIRGGIGMPASGPGALQKLIQRGAPAAALATRQRIPITNSAAGQ